MKIRNHIAQIFYNNSSVLFFFIIAAAILYGTWNTDDPYQPFYKGVILFILGVVLVALFTFLGFLNVIVINRFSTENSLSSHIHKLRVYIHHEIWNNKVFWYLFIPIQLINSAASILLREHYIIWAITLALVIIIGYFYKNLSNSNFLLPMILFNLILAVIFFIIINFRVIGVYYFWNLAGHDCFINYGFEEKGDPLANLEFFSSLREWEELGNPVPSYGNHLSFVAYDLKDNFIFYSYPITLFFPVFNLLYYFSTILKGSMIDRNT